MLSTNAHAKTAADFVKDYKLNPEDFTEIQAIISRNSSCYFIGKVFRAPSHADHMPLIKSKICLQTTTGCCTNSHRPYSEEGFRTRQWVSTYDTNSKSIAPKVLSKRSNPHLKVTTRLRINTRRISLDQRAIISVWGSRLTWKLLSLAENKTATYWRHFMEKIWLEWTANGGLKWQSLIWCVPHSCN